VTSTCIWRYRASSINALAPQKYPDKANHQDKRRAKKI
jgi:hypothetical protein